MEFALSNRCNLECIMCSGNFSSLIRARREKLPSLPEVYSEEFFTELWEYLPHLVRVKFYGGEPFVIPEYYRIWEKMIADGIQPERGMLISTNASIYNSRITRILNNIPTDMVISLDGITKKTYEKIRINADFKSIRKNIKKFRSYTKNKQTNLVFAVCLMQQNWHEFGDLLLFAEKMGCWVFINRIINPPGNSLFSLESGELKKIVTRMRKEEKKIIDKLKINRQGWFETIDVLEKHASNEDTDRINRLRYILDYCGSEESDKLRLPAIRTNGNQ